MINLSPIPQDDQHLPGFCRICGGPITKWSGTLYCSKACYGESRRKPGNPKIIRANECSICGAPVPKTGTKYCSHACYAQSRRHPKEFRMRQCEVCGKPFEIRTYHRKTRHCSTQCASRGLTRLPILTKACPACGKEFETKKSQHQYCSVECKHEHRRMKERERRANLAQRECPTCKRVFKPKKNDSQRYCSRRCTMLDPTVRELLDQGTSSIEQVAHGVLDNWRVEYQTQVRVGPYFLDIYVPRLNLALEIHGCYWHACDICGYQDADRQEHDRLRKEFITKSGYRMVEVWEHDIERDAEGALLAAFQRLNTP